MILRRLDKEIKEVTHGLGIPTYDHALMSGEMMDVDLLWDKEAKVLEIMIIVRSKLSTVDPLRKLERIWG